MPALCVQVWHDVVFLRFACDLLVFSDYQRFRLLSIPNVIFVKKCQDRRILLGIIHKISSKKVLALLVQLLQKYWILVFLLHFQFRCAMLYAWITKTQAFFLESWPWHVAQNNILFHFPFLWYGILWYTNTCEEPIMLSGEMYFV